MIDSVYGDRMGNHSGTHDGSTFIGRGLSQVTGRDGYTKLGAMIELDLIGHPELIVAPEHALECGVADFIICGCLPFAKNNDIVGVTRHLNGGQIGLAEREQWLAKWKAALGTSAPQAAPVARSVPLNSPPLIAPGSSGVDVQRLQTMLGIPATGQYIAHSETEWALRLFQVRHGLSPDGVAGPKVWLALQAHIST